MYIDRLLAICRSHNGATETVATVQVEVDEADCRRHLLENASYIALRMPLLDQAASEGFYDPTGSGMRIPCSYTKGRR